MLKENPLLVVVVLAIIAAVVVVLTGHAGDGNGLLAALFGIMGAAGGGHMAAMMPGAPQSKNDQPQDGAQVSSTN